MKPESHAVAIRDDPRPPVIEKLRGTLVHIPDLQCLMHGWPQGVHPDVDRLEVEVSQILESIFSSPQDAKRLQKVKASGLALFGASWWACVPYEKLRIATHLMIWLFTWDDGMLYPAIFSLFTTNKYEETDSHEYSSLVYDVERSRRFREDTLLFLKETLLPRDESRVELSINPIIANFKPIGDAISESYDHRRVGAFLDELRFYIEMTEEEQQLQSVQKLPTIGEYMRRRMGSGAVRVLLAITEYVYNLDIPHEVMEQGFMEKIWDETNIIISVVNDILSIKKEIDQEQIDSLIPLLTLEVGTGQLAINKAVEMVDTAVQRFEQAEEDALASCRSRSTVLEDVPSYRKGTKLDAKI
ncbi:isoprenoid synthase domain-containing protein [Xylaria longipes]|nr:isoprenoid synthase domain-containing protein [Xylaria longipes]